MCEIKNKKREKEKQRERRKHIPEARGKFVINMMMRI